jgi:hypothetical protein
MLTASGIRNTANAIGIGVIADSLNCPSATKNEAGAIIAKKLVESFSRYDIAAGCRAESHRLHSGFVEQTG